MFKATPISETMGATINELNRVAPRSSSQAIHLSHEKENRKNRGFKLVPGRSTASLISGFPVPGHIFLGSSHIFSGGVWKKKGQRKKKLLVFVWVISIYQRPFQLNHQKKKKRSPCTFPQLKEVVILLSPSPDLSQVMRSFFVQPSFFFKRTEKKNARKLGVFLVGPTFLASSFFFGSGAWLMESAGD